MSGVVVLDIRVVTRSFDLDLLEIGDGKDARVIAIAIQATRLWLGGGPTFPRDGQRTTAPAHVRRARLTVDEQRDLDDEYRESMVEILAKPACLHHGLGVQASAAAGVGTELALAAWATLAWALAPALLFRMFSTLNQSLGQPQWVTWIQVAGLALKIPLSIGLTFGWGGLAAQGVNGCAQATLVVNILMFVMALALLRRQAFYKPYRIWQAMERPHWPSLLEMLKIGVPNAISITVEVTSYTLMALFIARLGNTASASHQIVANLGALLYMVPLSLAIATSARVSYWVGAQNFAHAQAATRQGFALLLGVCSLLLLGIALGREFIAHLYTRDAAVAELASELMAWLTWYQAVDAFQVMCFFLLRCFRITLAPLVVYTLLLWGVGLTGGYLLAYKGVLNWGPLQSPEAFWMTSSLALTGVALGLGLLLHFAVQARAQR